MHLKSSTPMHAVIAKHEKRGKEEGQGDNSVPI